MTFKNKVALRIRGWFPQTPALPKPQVATAQVPPARTQTVPLPPVLENKFQRGAGLVIGLGLGLVLTGGIATLFSMQTYQNISRYVGYEGAASDNWLFRDLTSQLSIYLSILAAGAICVLWGFLMSRSNTARWQTLNPNRVSSGLIGGGGAAAFGSFRMLFMYLLTGDVVQLWLFVPFFAFGTVLMGAGFLGWRQKPAGVVNGGV